MELRTPNVTSPKPSTGALDSTSGKELKSIGRLPLPASLLSVTLSHFYTE